MADQKELADVIESRSLSRREFLTRVAMLGLLASAGKFVLDDPTRAMAATSSGGTAIQPLPTTIIEAGRRLRDGSLRGCANRRVAYIAIGYEQAVQSLSEPASVKSIQPIGASS